MSNTATHESLWLPGFEIDAPAYPDLFGSIQKSTTLAAKTPADAIEPPAADPPSKLPRAWRPTTVRSPERAAQNPAVTWPQWPQWPQWPDSALDGLEGQATKFDANLEAIAVLRAMERGRRMPTADERIAPLRFTGWGGIPIVRGLKERPRRSSTRRRAKAGPSTSG